MPLQFQNYGAAFTNAPTQREARDRSASILNVGEQISKLQESNALKKEREKREALLSDGDKKRVTAIQSDIDKLTKEYNTLSGKRIYLIARISDLKKSQSPIDSAGTPSETETNDNEFSYGVVAV